MKNVLEASRGLLRVAVVVVRGEGKSRTRAEGFGERELKTTLQCSATSAVTAESEAVFFWCPKYFASSLCEALRAFCCRHCPPLAFRRCFIWMLIDAMGGVTRFDRHRCTG